MRKLFVLALILTIVYSSSFVVPSEETALKVKLRLISKGFTSPVCMASVSDGSKRLFVVEQSGRIKIIKNGQLLPTPFLNLASHLDFLNIAYSEKGLLGLVFHPAYKSNGRFFVYYSAPYNERGFDHKSVLAEYRVSRSNPDVADTIGAVILEIPEPESNHNGGCLQFGRDRYLYIGVGDGGGAGDKHGSEGNGQNLGTCLGKILRIDVNGKKPYAVPADNPFVNRANARPEIYAYGLRNPWRFSFDSVLGTLFCADVGQDKWEEIDIIEKGKNYGWRIMEGRHCFNPSSGCNTAGLILPVNEYDHKTGVCIIGGYVYRGKMFPSLHGNYFFGDWKGFLFCLKKTAEGWKRSDVLSGDENSNDIGASINTFGEDEQGEIYVVTQHLIGPRSPTGAVYRIEL